jgi:hypothetical protein
MAVGLVVVSLTVALLPRSCASPRRARLFPREPGLQLQAEEGRLPRRGPASRSGSCCACSRAATPPTRPSVYMLACTALLALFLGFGKRRHELEGERGQAARGARGLLAAPRSTSRSASPAARPRHLPRLHARPGDTTSSSTRQPVDDGAVHPSSASMRFLLVSGKAAPASAPRAPRKRCCATPPSC